MPVSYDKLWKMLIDKKMKRTELKDAVGISFNVLAKMGKNEFVSMESLYKICVALDCGIDEIIRPLTNPSQRSFFIRKNGQACRIYEYIGGKQKERTQERAAC